jgi:hypothetical protein
MGDAAFQTGDGSKRKARNLTVDDGHNNGIDHARNIAQHFAGDNANPHARHIAREHASHAGSN